MRRRVVCPRSHPASLYLWGLQIQPVIISACRHCAPATAPGRRVLVLNRRLRFSSADPQVSRLRATCGWWFAPCIVPCLRRCTWRVRPLAIASAPSCPTPLLLFAARTGQSCAYGAPRARCGPVSGSRATSKTGSRPSRYSAHGTRQWHAKNREHHYRGYCRAGRVRGPPRPVRKRASTLRKVARKPGGQKRSVPSPR